MKRFKLSTEVLFSEDAIDALLEVKDVNAVLITDKFMVDSGMADMILKKLRKYPLSITCSDIIVSFRAVGSLAVLPIPESSVISAHPASGSQSPPLCP